MTYNPTTMAAASALREYVSAGQTITRVRGADLLSCKRSALRNQSNVRISVPLRVEILPIFSAAAEKEKGRKIGGWRQMLAKCCVVCWQGTKI